MFQINYYLLFVIMIAIAFAIWKYYKTEKFGTYSDYDIVKIYGPDYMIGSDNSGVKNNLDIVPYGYAS